MSSAEDLLRKFNNFKTLPHVAIRLSRLISDEECPIQRFEEVIKLDPSLVARLLRIINSSYYGLRTEITEISRAIIYVGMQNLRNMVVIEALKDVFTNGSDTDTFSKRQLWLHSAAVSICSKMISERIFEQRGEDVFLCGILHDIGMIVEYQVVEDLFIQACKTNDSGSSTFTKNEREIIGVDHCTVGSLLASNWKVPRAIQRGIEEHHIASPSVSPSSITGMIQLAEFFVARLNYVSMPGMKVKLPPPLEAHVRESIDEYKALIRDFPDEMTKAEELYEMGEE
jgi:HD-like signal output (HDOD) protein